MRLSVSLRTNGVTPAEVLERAETASAAGIESLYVGDHHSVADGYVQNNVILARILAGWEGSVGAVYIVPLWHPVLLAEQVGTLASLCRGRFVFQAALGYGRSQFDAMGVRLTDRVRLFEENLEMIQGLLAGETVSSEDQSVLGAAIEKHDSIAYWIAGHSDRALERAATKATGWIAGPGVVEAEATRLADSYRSACERAGSDVGELAIRRDVFVAETSVEARAALSQAVESGYRGLDPAVLIAGSPAEVVSQIVDLGGAGFGEVVVRQFVSDQRQACESLARLETVRQILDAG